MARQLYENKRVVKICGTLTKTDDGNYIVTVSDKDSAEVFDFNEILDASCGDIVTFSLEEDYR